ncbi:MAG TPA: L-threonylcarbamoyladenylate synthase [Nocardioidaceae bacterium]|nr:L-threonylcarbamoyladenylate synthase [Nocardioidaceae bacterium]
MTGVKGVDHLPDDEGAATPARFVTADEEQLEAGLARAALAVQRGQLVVLPTDTVYGVGADAFDPEAVRRLLDAKGRGRDMPPPVLVSAATTLDALAVAVPPYARALVQKLWPGPLTLVCRQQPSLQWDLGDTRGTVAVRMPDHHVALDLLSRTGPMAVSSANRSGMAAALDADSAEEMLGSSVEVILDGGPSPGPEPSTIVDVTGPQGRLLRAGVLGIDVLNQVVAHLDTEIADEG